MNQEQEKIVNEAREEIKALLREYLASETSKFLTSEVIVLEALRKNLQDFFGDRARVEVTPGWEENTFDVAVYANPAVEYVSVEFTVESKDQVSNPIEEQ